MSNVRPGDAALAFGLAALVYGLVWSTVVSGFGLMLSMSVLGPLLATAWAALTGACSARFYRAGRMRRAIWIGLLVTTLAYLSTLTVLFVVFVYPGENVGSEEFEAFFGVVATGALFILVPALPIGGSVGWALQRWADRPAPPGSTD